MKIGIFAGTFDPIHNGHLALAEAAIKSHKLDKVVFIIEKKPRRKLNVTPYRQRKAMLELALKNKHNLDIIEAREDQLTLAGTLPWLRGQFRNAELYILMGQDVAMHLKHWPDVELLKDATIILSPRAAQGPTSLAASHIRAQLASGQTSRDLPLPVAAYIKAKRLYAGDSKA